MAKYPGTNGSTQGEKNDKAPKKKAIDALISINLIYTATRYKKSPLLKSFFPSKF